MLAVESTRRMTTHTAPSTAQINPVSIGEGEGEHSREGGHIVQREVKVSCDVGGNIPSARCILQRVGDNLLRDDPVAGNVVQDNQMEALSGVTKCDVHVKEPGGSVQAETKWASRGDRNRSTW
jgi:hypothetical protein